MKKFIFVLFMMFCFLPSATLSQNSMVELLTEGKAALNKGDFNSSVKFLTDAMPAFPEIEDYILFWRAKAYKGMGNVELALKDITTIKKLYPNSPILKDVRKEELDLAKKAEVSGLKELYESFLKEYPEELSIKFEYAQFLKKEGDIEKAKKIFKEIFVTASSFAEKAELELAEDDITLNNLIKKAKNLNNAYQFNKSEKYLKEALKKANNTQKNEILSLLGYSIFMQKRYKEASEIFKQAGQLYWRARALLRARDFESFEREKNLYIKSKDERFSEVFINYANIKRRAGNNAEATKLLKFVVSNYPSAREDAMWYLGWNYYLNRDYDEARKIFNELYASYGKLKYLYWLEKTNEKNSVFLTKQHTVSFIPGDFYSYLLYIKGKISEIPESVSIEEPFILPPRIDILVKAGFHEEALKEIKWMIKNNRTIENIPTLTRILYSLGDYPTAVRLISKIPQKFNYQELIYPYPFRDIVLKASNKFKLDHNLIFAIMREESRFDRFAVSPAGAIGVMQLMPYTAIKEAKQLGIKYKNDTDLFEPKINILLGSFHLKKLIEEFGNIPMAVAAYNAGDKAVNQWLESNNYCDIDEFIEDIPYAETKAYVQRVLTSYAEYLRKDKNLSQEKLLK